jgi:hypothetical protein
MKGVGKLTTHAEMHLVHASSPCCERVSARKQSRPMAPSTRIKQGATDKTNREQSYN